MDSNKGYIYALHYQWLNGIYDPVVRLTTRETAVKRAIIELLPVLASGELLDVASGSGTLTRATRIARPGCVVRGCRRAGLNLCFYILYRHIVRQSDLIVGAAICLAVVAVGLHFVAVSHVSIRFIIVMMAPGSVPTPATIHCSVGNVLDFQVCTIRGYRRR